MIIVDAKNYEELSKAIHENKKEIKISNKKISKAVFKFKMTHWTIIATAISTVLGSVIGGPIVAGIGAGAVAVIIGSDTVKLLSALGTKSSKTLYSRYEIKNGNTIVMTM